MSREEPSLGQDGQTSSSSPLASPIQCLEEILKEILNPNWLRAHKRRSNIMKINSDNPDLTFVPELNSPPNLTADDVASKMAALPFGNNPFDEIDDTENYTPEFNQARPTVILAQTVVPLKTTDKEKQQRKRSGAFIAPGGGKGDTSKRGKQNVSNMSSGVAELYGSLAAMNLKEKDVKTWNDRDRTEASLNLRRDLGESFLHGMTYLNTLEGEHASLERSLKTTQDSSDYYKGQLNDAEKKIFDLGEAHKEEAKNFKKIIAELTDTAKSENEAHAKAMETLQAELDGLKASQKKIQREA
ncbi:hypothetical protein POM88_004409 [Heracleum sosnowskyi]|uniref:Uncharacterized protein n=1 Tax=Heracleum sosnowskyi TaxID=360622 RepID=A0AAD8JJS4_9APIA|nr:hypothetical protein POM88_004409 [Heracleum sosnowskyi]